MALNYEAFYSGSWEQILFPVLCELYTLFLLYFWVVLSQVMGSFLTCVYLALFNWVHEEVLCRSQKKFCIAFSSPVLCLQTSPTLASLDNQLDVCRLGTHWALASFPSYTAAWKLFPDSNLEQL